MVKEVAEEPDGQGGRPQCLHVPYIDFIKRGQQFFTAPLYGVAAPVGFVDLATEVGGVTAALFINRRGQGKP